MTDDPTLLVHAAGYSTIATVLALANWSPGFAVVFILPLVAGSIGFAGRMLYRNLVDHARDQIDGVDADQPADPAAAGD